MFMNIQIIEFEDVLMEAERYGITVEGVVKPERYGNRMVAEQEVFRIMTVEGINTNIPKEIDSRLSVIAYQWLRAEPHVQEVGDRGLHCQLCAQGTRRTDCHGR